MQCRQHNKLLSAAVLVGILLNFFAGTAFSAVSEEKAAWLENRLTPVGAIRAGNASGTIPEWEGGIAEIPADYRVGQEYIDPYATDAPRFTITQSNYKQYQSKLTDGHQEMFERHPKYKMVVYPTRRSASFPPEIYEWTKRNATSARLVNGAPVNAAVGIPFAIPDNGEQAVWNHRTRYRGDSVRRWNVQTAVMETGDTIMYKMKEELQFDYSRIGTAPEKLDNLLVYFLQETVEPARLAGQFLIVHETIDAEKEPRNAWMYTRGARRVRAAPQIGYDNRGTNAEGLRTVDQVDMFNGPLDRYNWRLVGRQEAFIPYNSFKLYDRKLSYTDILDQGHINQDLARYELHRVWVVEATLKPGLRHLYKRRVFYIDEDTWQIVAADIYDNRDELWKVQEAHTFNGYDAKSIVRAIEVIYDMPSRRYLIQAMSNEEPVNKLNIFFGEDYFAPKVNRK